MLKLLYICVLGRLLSYASDECPSVKKLLEDVRETCGKTCHLLPLFSCLKLEGAEIFKKNVGSGVCSLATSTIVQLVLLSFLVCLTVRSTSMN